MIDKNLIDKTINAISVYKKTDHEYFNAYIKSLRSENKMIYDYLRNNMHGLSDDEQRELYIHIDCIPVEKIPHLILNIHNEKLKKEKVYKDYEENIYTPQLNKIICSLVYDITPENSIKRNIYSSYGTRDIMNDFKEYNFIILNTAYWGQIIIIENHYYFKANHGCTITDIKTHKYYECKIPMLLYIEKEQDKIFDYVSHNYDWVYIHKHRDEISELNNPIPFDQAYPIRAQTKKDTYGRTRNYLAIGFIPTKYRYFL